MFEQIVIFMAGMIVGAATLLGVAIYAACKSRGD